MGLACPRCKFDGVKRTEENFGQLNGRDLIVIKYNCANCESRWLFEEDLTAYLSLVTNAAKESSNKQGAAVSAPPQTSNNAEKPSKG